MGILGQDKVKDRRVKELCSDPTVENEEEVEVPVYWGKSTDKRSAAKSTNKGIQEYFCSGAVEKW